MRFSVSVPVLSTHKIVVAPKSSMAGMLRVSTFSRAKRQAPSPRKMVNITGSSSGRIAMAKVKPVSKPFNHSPVSTPCTNAKANAAAKPTSATRLTISRVSS